MLFFIDFVGSLPEYFYVFDTNAYPLKYWDPERGGTFVCVHTLKGTLGHIFLSLNQDTISKFFANFFLPAAPSPPFFPAFRPREHHPVRGAARVPNHAQLPRPFLHELRHVGFHWPPAFRRQAQAGRAPQEGEYLFLLFSGGKGGGGREGMKIEG